MSYYLFVKSGTLNVWECLEHYADFRGASHARNAYNDAVSERGGKSTLMTMVHGDTEALARTVLENRVDELT